jgi:hypothetical protein
MTEKPLHVRDMTPAEAAAELARLIKLNGRPAPPPPPVDPDAPKLAKDLTAQERAEWWAAHRKRFPS